MLLNAFSDSRVSVEQMLRRVSHFYHKDCFLPLYEMLKAVVQVQLNHKARFILF